MAFVPSDANLVWQQLKATLSAGIGSNPASAEAFNDLRKYLATQGGNAQLQILPFTEADCDAAGGTAILTGACRIYGVWVKKLNSATDNLFLVYDDATNDTTDANARIALSVLEANKEAFAIYPTGLPMATGVLVTQYTSASGLGKADGSDGADGFVLIGAA